MKNTKKYVVTLSDVFNSYFCEVEVMDQKRICTPIPKLKDSELINELKEYGIFVSDASVNENCCLFEREPNEIHMLLGGRHNRKFANRRRGQTFKGRISGCKHTFGLDSYGKNENGKGKAFQCAFVFTCHPFLSNCRNLAERRLKNCVRSLERSKNLGKYEAVFHSWQNEDIIEEVQNVADKKNEHYLPHHPVYKDNSTTKIRPVFDGSAKEKNSSSINECLEKGPNMVELIPTIVNKFRLRKFGITADIEKAFLQIGLQEKDRPFLRFLWWENGDKEKTKIYQHKRVVFGITSSPFLLGATLEYHLKQVSGHLQLTAQKLLESFYVDNCLTSVDNAEDIERFMLESKDILSLAKFNLRGWVHTGVSEAEKGTLLEEKKKVPVLGLIWKPDKDTLSVNWEENSKINEIPVTKRKILSAVHRIFDPIGCISKELSPNSDLSLHVFCDASKAAYASCVFLRTEVGGAITCQLVQARARVASIKPITIPRLELLACTIGSRLINTTKIDLGLENVPIYCWSDSVNALYWIKRKENWGTFVNNRVQEIRRLTNPEDWKHIPGILNPADLPSRGCGVVELIASLWWEGPSWLNKPREEWPLSEACPDRATIDSERKRTVASTINHEPKEMDYLSEISSFKKIIRVTAWIYRFYHNLRKQRNDRDFGELITQETDAAERKVLKIVQKQSFSNDTKSLVSQMQTLVDSDGIIRIKSKIIMRKDVESIRYPIVLPSRHPIVTKLIIQKHIELLHAGVQTVMSALRENYWILKSRKTVRRVLSECIICKRFTVRPLTTLSPPLPEDRVREAQIFEITGVDLCGSLFLRDRTKSWILLFTCAVFRAVHMELVTSLSTESFILALRRFISRRGRSFTIYSDNGKNLVGTSNELKNIDWKKVKDYGSLKKINWKLNPPSSPWWGGFWERLVGMLKIILRRVLGKACLTYEELYTVVCDSESVINSRPLTYLSEDQEDLVALTPAMFLQEIKENGVPDLDLIDSQRMNRRFLYRQRIRQELRKRFRLEYLGQLKSFSKSRKEDVIKEKDIVLIGDTNSKRIYWPLAKVIKLIPGRDRRVRVVEVSTSSGSFLRPIQRLYPLEVSGTDISDLPEQIKETLKDRV
ncbi:integrase catalytic domain-containing protein [Trichonephila clavipes]|nr:integrase catalytic domain-containing protein [Trichonephila clavipes]